MITMLNCDCLGYMKSLPDGAYNLAIVDPPYFQAYSKKQYTGAAVTRKGVKRNQFESKEWEIPGDEYFNELKRVSQNQIVWGANYFNCFDTGGAIVWDKENDSSTFSNCEIASCSFGVGVFVFRFAWNGMIQGDIKNKETKIHACQKPVALYKWLLSRYAKPGDRILDTHGGSGSIAIACHDLGYDLTLMELDADYYAAACKRYKEHALQETLFTAEEIRQPIQGELI